MAFTQNIADSLSQRTSTATEMTRIDSLRKKVLLLPDTLSPSFQRVDSIRNEFAPKLDSVQQEYHQAVSELEAKTTSVIKTIDSLQHLQLPTNRYTRELDSLHQLKDKVGVKYKTAFDSLKAKTIGRLQSLDLPPEYKEPLQKLTTNITGLSVDTDIAKIPPFQLSGYSLPEVKGLPDLTSNTGQLGDIEQAVKLPSVQTPIGDLDQVSAQAGAYQKDVKNITHGNIQDVEKLPETIEAHVSKIDGMDELQKQSGVIDGQKAQLDELAELNDPAKAKEKAVTIAKEKAVDHFAGKQEQLKAAMDRISKYKQKYSSVSSIKDLPKRPPNPMKGKPFIERLTPGVYLQYQLKNYYLVDVNPYVGYKLSGRFTAGMGWNHRLAWDSKRETWNKRSRIFGPRGFVYFKIGKGFIAHIEGESMNSFIPSTLHGNPDAGRREWVWSLMTGLKKEYKIYKNVKGTALIQYNLFNRYFKAPYVDRLNSRIGFEYVIKKTKKRK